MSSKRHGRGATARDSNSANRRGSARGGRGITAESKNQRAAVTTTTVSKKRTAAATVGGTQTSSPSKRTKKTATSSSSSSTVVSSSSVPVSTSDSFGGKGVDTGVVDRDATESDDTSDTPLSIVRQRNQTPKRPRQRIKYIDSPVTDEYHSVSTTESLLMIRSQPSDIVDDRVISSSESNGTTTRVSLSSTSGTSASSSTNITIIGIDGQTPFSPPSGSIRPPNSTMVSPRSTSNTLPESKNEANTVSTTDADGDHHPNEEALLAIETKQLITTVTAMVRDEKVPAQAAMDRFMAVECKWIDRAIAAFKVSIAISVDDKVRAAFMCLAEQKVEKYYTPHQYRVLACLLIKNEHRLVERLVDAGVTECALGPLLHIDYRNNPEHRDRLTDEQINRVIGRFKEWRETRGVRDPAASTVKTWSRQPRTANDIGSGVSTSGDDHDTKGANDDHDIDPVISRNSYTFLRSGKVIGGPDPIIVEQPLPDSDGIKAFTDDHDAAVDLLPLVADKKTLTATQTRINNGVEQLKQASSLIMDLTAVNITKTSVLFDAIAQCFGYTTLSALQMVFRKAIQERLPRTHASLPMSDVDGVIIDKLNDDVIKEWMSVINANYTRHPLDQVMAKEVLHLLWSTGVRYGPSLLGEAGPKRLLSHRIDATYASIILRVTALLLCRQILEVNTPGRDFVIHVGGWSDHHDHTSETMNRHLKLMAKDAHPIILITTHDPSTLERDVEVAYVKIEPKRKRGGANSKATVIESGERAGAAEPVNVRAAAVASSAPVAIVDDTAPVTVAALPTSSDDKNRRRSHRVANIIVNKQLDAEENKDKDDNNVATTKASSTSRRSSRPSTKKRKNNKDETKEEKKPVHVQESRDSFISDFLDLIEDAVKNDSFEYEEGITTIQRFRRYKQAKEERTPGLRVLRDAASKDECAAVRPRLRVEHTPRTMTLLRKYHAGDYEDDDDSMKQLQVNDNHQGSGYACDLPSSTSAAEMSKILDEYEASFESVPKKTAPSEEEAIKLIKPSTRVEWKFDNSGGMIQGPGCNVLVIALAGDAKNMNLVQHVYRERMRVANAKNGEPKGYHLNMGEKQSSDDIRNSIGEYVKKGVRFVWTVQREGDLIDLVHSIPHWLEKPYACVTSSFNYADGVDLVRAYRDGEEFRKMLLHQHDVSELVRQLKRTPNRYVVFMPSTSGTVLSKRDEWWCSWMAYILTGVPLIGWLLTILGRYLSAYEKHDVDMVVRKLLYDEYLQVEEADINDKSQYGTTNRYMAMWRSIVGCEKENGELQSEAHYKALLPDDDDDVEEPWIDVAKKKQLEVKWWLMITPHERLSVIDCLDGTGTIHIDKLNALTQQLNDDLTLHPRKAATWPFLPKEADNTIKINMYYHHYLLAKSDSKEKVWLRSLSTQTRGGILSHDYHIDNQPGLFGATTSMSIMVDDEVINEAKVINANNINRFDPHYSIFLHREAAHLGSMNMNWGRDEVQLSLLDELIRVGIDNMEIIYDIMSNGAGVEDQSDDNDGGDAHNTRATKRAKKGEQKQVKPPTQPNITVDGKTVNATNKHAKVFPWHQFRTRHVMDKSIVDVMNEEWYKRYTGAAPPADPKLLAAQLTYDDCSHERCWIEKKRFDELKMKDLKMICEAYQYKSIPTKKDECIAFIMDRIESIKRVDEPNITECINAARALHPKEQPAKDGTVTRYTATFKERTTPLDETYQPTERQMNQDGKKPYEYVPRLHTDAVVFGALAKQAQKLFKGYRRIATPLDQRCGYWGELLSWGYDGVEEARVAFQDAMEQHLGCTINRLSVKGKQSEQAYEAFRKVFGGSDITARSDRVNNLQLTAPLRLDLMLALGYLKHTNGKYMAAEHCDITDDDIEIMSRVMGHQVVMFAQRKEIVNSDDGTPPTKVATVSFHHPERVSTQKDQFIIGENHRSAIDQRLAAAQATAGQYPISILLCNGGHYELMVPGNIEDTTHREKKDVVDDREHHDDDDTKTDRDNGNTSSSSLSSSIGNGESKRSSASSSSALTTSTRMDATYFQGLVLDSLAFRVKLESEMKHLGISMKDGDVSNKLVVWIASDYVKAMEFADQRKTKPQQRFGRYRLRIAAMVATLSIIKRQQYEVDDGKIVKFPEVDMKTITYGSEGKSQVSSFTKQLPYPPPHQSTEVVIVELDCLVAVQRLQSNGSAKVALLNMASPYHPGGAYCQGYGTQEEQIAYRTNYMMAIDQRWNPSAPHYDEKKSDEHGLKGCGGHYTRNALTFRGTESDGYPWLPEPFLVDIIAVAAMKIDDPNSYDFTSPLYLMTMRKKIESIFLMAHENGIASLVLSALGCGAYGNDPKVVAAIFKEVIQQYAGIFKHIQFAILQDAKGTNNIDAFKSVFGSDRVMISPMASAANNRYPPWLPQYPLSIAKEICPKGSGCSTSPACAQYYHPPACPRVNCADVSTGHQAMWYHDHRTPSVVQLIAPPSALAALPTTAAATEKKEKKCAKDDDGTTNNTAPASSHPVAASAVTAVGPPVPPAIAAPSPTVLVQPQPQSRQSQSQSQSTTTTIATATPAAAPKSPNTLTYGQLSNSEKDKYRVNKSVNQIAANPSGGSIQFTLLATDEHVIIAAPTPVIAIQPKGDQTAVWLKYRLSYRSDDSGEMEDKAPSYKDIIECARAEFTISDDIDIAVLVYPAKTRIDNDQQLQSAVEQCERSGIGMDLRVFRVHSIYKHALVDWTVQPSHAQPPLPPPGAAAVEFEVPSHIATPP